MAVVSRLARLAQQGCLAFFLLQTIRLSPLLLSILRISSLLHLFRSRHDNTTRQRPIYNSRISFDIIMFASHRITIIPPSAPFINVFTTYAALCPYAQHSVYQLYIPHRIPTHTICHTINLPLEISSPPFVIIYIVRSLPLPPSSFPYLFTLSPLSRTLSTFSVPFMTRHLCALGSHPMFACKPIRDWGLGVYVV